MLPRSVNIGLYNVLNILFYNFCYSSIYCESIIMDCLKHQTVQVQEFI